MVQAGASIEAFLKLDATGFKTGMTEAMESVKLFKTSMMDLGKNSATVQLGVDRVSKAVQNFILQLSKLSSLSKEVNTFEKFARGLERIATAAQRVSVDVRNGAVGIDSLNAIVQAYATGVENASFKVNGLATALKNLNAQQSQTRSSIQSTQQAINGLTVAQKTLRSQFLMLESAIDPTIGKESEARFITQKLREEYNLTGLKLIEVRNQMLQTTEATVQYGSALTQPITQMEHMSRESTKLSTSLARVSTTLQRWKSLTDSIVNSTSQNVSSMVSRINTSLGNLTNNLNKTNTSTVNLSNTQGRWVGTLNSTDGTIKRATTSVQQYAHALSIPTKYMQEGGAVAQEYRILQKGVNLTIEDNINTLRRQSAEIQKNAVAILRAMGYIGELSMEEEKLAMAEEKVSQSSIKESTSLDRVSNSANRSASSMNRASTQASRLGKILSSLRSIGMLVGSMLAYNFAHKLLVATGETVHAKSEMEGYFKMLHYGQDDIKKFNDALDQTVQRFQRVNKYSLGETISSIGVEFDLTTDEMIKAMDVTSMITSEYLRAGRNANEASLAVKDVLQGQFQRLSRETGVKGEQLKEAGWNGDVTDVNSLLDALRKVGEDRNWDVFAEKANSLNDILTILQNRFGEWSADMVNVVQPSIVGAFNSIMSFSQGLSESLGNLWQWLNGGSLGATITQIGLLGTTLLTVTQALVQYRTGMGLAQTSQLGFKKLLASLILGLKGQEIAEVGVRNAILSKILGVRAETLATKGMTYAIKESTLQTKLQSVEEQINSATKGENSVASKLNTVEQKLNKAATDNLIIAKDKEAIQEELNTISKEANTLATIEQEGANTGLIASLYMLGTREAIVTGETSALAIAMGVLNGVIALSPIGWFMGALIALAGAFYVLTGGLDSTYASMKEFKEIMQDTGSAESEANEWLESVKQRAGEDSEEFKRASDSVEAYKQNLQSASYWYKEAEKTFKGGDLSRRANTWDVLTKHGFTPEQAEEYNKGLDALSIGKDKYYTALQVYNKQFGDSESNFVKDLDSSLTAMEKYTDDQKELNGMAQDMSKNYQNLAEHSYIANTSDDWWEGSWNRLYAGLDQLWIDWDKAKIRFGQWKKDIGDMLRGTIDGFSEWASGIPDWLGTIPDQISKWGQDVWKRFTDWIDDIPKSIFGNSDETWGSLFKPITDLFDGTAIKNLIGDHTLGGDLTWVWDTYLKPYIQPLIDFFQNGGIGGWIQSQIGDWNLFDWIMDAIFPQSVSASDGSSDHPSFMEDISNILGFDVQSWIDSFKADPLGTLGLPDPLNIMDLFGALFSLTEGDTTPIMEWFNQTLIVPISEFLLGFMMDPVSYIGNFGFTITQFLDGILGTDFTGIWQWTMDTIVTPIGQGLWDGLMQVPIVGDILMLLSLLSNENIGADAKGRAIANWIGNGITTAIGQIPIVGDLLRILGLIPQTQPTANSQGMNMGQAIDKGVKDGIKNIASQVGQEFQDAIDAIGKLKDQAEQTASDWASRVWDGVNSVLQRHSPGFIHDQFLAEFGTDIPNAIQSSSDLAYSTAQYYGQQVKNGVASATQTNLGLDTMVGEYQSDAQTIATSSEMMGTNTTTAFNNMQVAVNQSTSQMKGNVTSTYSAMQQKQALLLNNMKSSNTTAYNDMYLKSNQSLVQMRDSTTNVTHQMTNAWIHMKDQIVATANRLKSDTSSHFNQLSSNIGEFYRKIQNPSNWGAGVPTRTSHSRRPSVGRSAVRTIRGQRGAGVNPYINPNKMMSLRELMSMVGGNKEVKLSDFLAMFSTGGFGWSGWNSRHYSHIKNTSDKWSMKAPMILGKYQAGSGFKVGDFEGRTPTIGFDDYVATAEAIFGSIPYSFYYNSEKWGSWDNAIKHGEANCSDGADALIALAHTMNPSWSTEKVHTTLKGGTGHFYAVINGKVMDTTAFQNRGSWGHLGAGISPRKAIHNGGGNENTTNHTVNVTITGDVYGVDDLENRIEEGVKKGLREEFNDPYTVAI